MPPAAPSDFCAYLRRIVELLEKGEWTEAAAAASEMEKLVASSPPALSPSELAEAQQLMARYGELAESLKQQTSAGMTRLGAAGKVRAYLQQSMRAP